MCENLEGVKIRLATLQESTKSISRPFGLSVDFGIFWLFGFRKYVQSELAKTATQVLCLAGCF